jgi:hypothetical protein
MGQLAHWSLIRLERGLLSRDRPGSPTVDSTLLSTIERRAIRPHATIPLLDEVAVGASAGGPGGQAFWA